MRKGGQTAEFACFDSTGVLARAQAYTDLRNSGLQGQHPNRHSRAQLGWTPIPAASPQLPSRLSIGLSPHSRAETDQNTENGRRGEEAAYFHLRQLGYVMVAKNFRSPRAAENRPLGWEGKFFASRSQRETTRDVKPAHAPSIARSDGADCHGPRILHHLRTKPAWRLDVISVYIEDPTRPDRASR